MFDKRNRWIAIVIMAIAAFAFAGVSIIVPFTGMFQNPPSTASSSPTASPTNSGAELAAQAKGYEAVLQREPNNQTALRGLVDVKIQQGDIKGIIAPLEKLAALNPNQPDYMVLLAQAKQRTNDREGAAQVYRDILAKHPGDMNALQGLTGLLMQQQRPEAAIGVLQDTLRTADETNQAKPGSVDVASVKLLLGELYATQQRYDEALALYDQVSQSNKQDFRPILGKAIILKTQGKLEEAKPLFASAAALAPAQFKDQINKLAEVNPSPAASPASPAPSPQSSASPSPADISAPAPAASGASPAGQ